MAAVTLGVGNVVLFPGRQASGIRTTAQDRMDQRTFLDMVHSSRVINLFGQDEAARHHAVRFCILGLVQIDEEQDDGSFRRLKPSQAFQTQERHLWRISRRGTTLPDIVTEKPA